MKIFLDTADLEEIRLACSWGIINGVTTNPSLIKTAVESRENITMEDYLRKILELVPGPVSLEVIALNEKEMIDQAKKLYNKFSPYGEVAIKIPINTSMSEATDDFEGLKTIKKLRDDDIPVNVTLIMTPEQAILAAKAGATYVSPFAGRIDDHIRSNLSLKRGVDYRKRDYFDTTVVQQITEKIVAKKLRTSLEKTPSFNQLYTLLEDVTNIGHDKGIYSGVDLISRILKLYNNYGYSTKVIAASIRSARQVREVAELGVHIATIPFVVLREMISHYKTVEGIKSFTADIVPAYEKLFN